MANTHDTLKGLFSDIATSIKNKGVTGQETGGKMQADKFPTYINSIATQKPEQTKTAYPTGSDQTITPDSGKVLSSVAVKKVTTTNLSAGNIASGVTVKVGRVDDDDAIASVTGTATLLVGETREVTLTSTPTTYTPSSGKNGITSIKVTASSGTAGTPSASKGTVSSNQVTVTPSVTNTTGWITGGTKTGTGVVVKASELVSGTKTITGSGNTDVTNYASASVASASVSENAGSISGTSYSQGSVSVPSAGWITSGTKVNGATFGNVATSGVTYKDISATTAAPELVSGDYLYINKGYTDAVKISLAKLIPDAHGADISSDKILQGYDAYDKDGNVVAGSIPTKTASGDVILDDETPTKSYEAGYYPNAHGAEVSIGTLASGSGSVSASGTNITLGTGTTTKPTSGSYITTTGSGSVSVSYAGYLSNQSKSSNTATKYYPIASKGAATYNTSTSDQTISASQWLTGAQTIKAVTTSNIDAANIKVGVNVKVGDANSAGRIKNVTGTFTSDATATADNIYKGKTAYVNGVKVTGTAEVTLEEVGASGNYKLIMPEGFITVS